MQNNSTHLIFSFYQNVITILKKQQSTDVYYLVPRTWFQSIQPYTKKHLLRIYSEMENGLYSFRDIYIYMLTRALYGENTTIADIKMSKVKPLIEDVYSSARFDSDRKMLEKIAKDRGYEKFSELFHVHEDGTNLMYDMITSKELRLAPTVYIRYYKNFLTLPYEFIKFSDDRMNRFNFIINLLFKTFQKGAK